MRKSSLNRRTSMKLKYQNLKEFTKRKENSLKMSLALLRMTSKRSRDKSRELRMNEMLSIGKKTNVP